MPRSACLRAVEPLFIGATETEGPCCSAALSLTRINWLPDNGRGSDSHAQPRCGGKHKNNNCFFFPLPPKSLSSCVASSSPLIINESSSACSAHRRSTGSLPPVSFSSITGLAAALIVARVPSFLHCTVALKRDMSLFNDNTLPTVTCPHRSAPFDTHLAGAL